MQGNKSISKQISDGREGYFRRYTDGPFRVNVTKPHRVYKELSVGRTQADSIVYQEHLGERRPTDIHYSLQETGHHYMLQFSMEKCIC